MSVDEVESLVTYVSEYKGFFSMVCVLVYDEETVVPIAAKVYLMCGCSRLLPNFLIHLFKMKMCISVLLGIGVVCHSKNKVRRPIYNPETLNEIQQLRDKTSCPIFT